MNYFLVVPLSVLALSVLWVVTIRFRRPRDLDALLKKIRPEIALRLFPFIETGDPARCMDEGALSEAIGGFNGIRAIHREAGIMATIAARLSEEVPDAHELAEEMFLDSFYLRVITPFCIIEEWVYRKLPQLPRALGWTYARLYCRLNTSLVVAISMDGAPQCFKFDHR